MIRGTTPTHIFQIPFSTELLKEVRISYAQNDEVVVEKTTEDCELEENKIVVTLEQEETLSFVHGKMVEVQLKVLTVSGTVLATPILRKDVGEILNDEVLA